MQISEALLFCKVVRKVWKACLWPGPDTLLLTSFLISLWLMLNVISLLENLSSGKWLHCLDWTGHASGFTAFGGHISEASEAWLSFAWSIASIST